MRDRIINAVVTAVVHNKKMSIAGLVCFLGLAAAKLGLEVSPDVLVWLAGLVIVALGAAGRDGDGRGARKALPLLLLCLALTQTACPKTQTVRTVAAATSAAAAAFKAEIGPELTDGERETVFAIADEVAAASEDVRSRAVDWDGLSPAQKAALARFAAERLHEALDRLASVEVGARSERAREVYARFQKHGMRAVSALRVIEAALAARAETAG